MSVGTKLISCKGSPFLFIFISFIICVICLLVVFSDIYLYRGYIIYDYIYVCIMIAYNKNNLKINLNLK